MAEKKLARHVTVAGTTYGPGDDVPADVAEQIKNPKAWVPLDEEAPTDGTDGREAGTTSGHRLATTVTVGGKSYGPNDPVPDDIAAQITNPKAWAGGRVPTTDAKSATKPAAKTDGGSSSTEREPADGEATSAEDGEQQDDKPRRTNRRS